MPKVSNLIEEFEKLTGRHLVQVFSKLYFTSLCYNYSTSFKNIIICNLSKCSFTINHIAEHTSLFHNKDASNF